MTARWQGILTVLCLAALSVNAQQRFEALAWVDHFDFAGVKIDGNLAFDGETTEGNEKTLDHVQETGATVILWRNCAGATMRYQSRIESHHQDAPFDKRRLPDNRAVHGWVRYGDAEPDILRHVFQVCEQRDLVPGVHWPFEENHWGSWTLGGWNLDHPQYWCRDVDGRPWAGRCSLAYAAVVEHKLNLLDELIERGMDVLFVDTYRSGGWSPAYEYVPPMIETWKTAHQGEPPPADPTDEAWCRHVSRSVTALFRKMRARMNASGRNIRFIVGAFGMDGSGNAPLKQKGLDWKTLVAENIVDGIVINGVPWSAERPFESTRGHYRTILDIVDGRCDVYCPVRAYDYSGYGMPSYAEVTGLPQHEIAEKLLRMAWEEGAAGISMECVDYNNYRPQTRKTMHDMLTTECRLRRR